VPPERRAEIFEFGKTSKVGGSGIGLPLSQLIVESHGRRFDLSRSKLVTAAAQTFA